MSALFDDSQFAVVFSGTTVSGTNFAISALANRAAIIQLIFYAAVTGVTCSLGGVAGVLIANTSVASPGGTFRVMMFSVTAPPSGSQPASASWTTSAACTM